MKTLIGILLEFDMSFLESSGVLFKCKSKYEYASAETLSIFWNS